MFQITKLNPGDIYEPKTRVSPDVSIQVGRGGDCGIVLGPCKPETFAQAPVFRVLVNQKDLRKHWKKVGAFTLHPQLNDLAWYADADIGGPQRYRVTLEDVDQRIPIDDSEYKKLERLAAWETIHILNRIRA